MPLQAAAANPTPRMNAPQPFPPQPAGDSGGGQSLDRRSFLKAGLGSVVSGALLGAAQGAPPPTAETLVAQLYQSLSEDQRALLCFAFDHPQRTKVDNNWMINKSQKELLNPAQRDLVRQIFLGLHSPEYAKRVFDQVVHDSEGEGFEAGTSISLFGAPGASDFEFVLTGRHCTRRCDGNSVKGAAFGGPIFYGHAPKGFREEAGHPDNAYWYQAVRANEVFKMLDGRQRESALVEKVREERQTATVSLSGKKTGLPGIPMEALSPDQKQLVRKVLSDVLAPFRKDDVEESLRLIEPQFDALHMAFCKSMDIGKDGVWDVWQIEGPSMIWLFRGAPHVHTWVHIRES
jgi:hypothetical protein